MKPYDALLFDLNGTLINDIPLVLETIQKGFLELGGKDLSMDQVLSAEFGLKQDIYLTALMRRHEASFDLESFNQFRYAYYWKNIQPEHRLLPSTQGMLSQLKKDYELGLVTSSNRFSLQNTLSREELSLFDVTLTADDCTNGKPDPEPLLQAARVLGKEPVDCLYVGDGLHDALAARAAGMDFVGIKGLTVRSEKLTEEGALVILDRVSDLKLWLSKEH